MALLGLVIACLVMAATPSATGLIFAVFLLRLAGQGMTSHIAVVAMARWYVAQRGRALSIAGLGYALGEAALPLIFVSLLGIFDWRILWVVAAALAAIAAPVIYLALTRERTPDAIAQDSAATGIGARHWGRAEVLRSPIFWLIVPAILGPSAYSTAFFFHQVHMAEVKGWSHVALVALFPVFTLAGVSGMMTTGWFIDRIGVTRLMPLYLLPFILGFLIMYQTNSLAGAALCMIFLGLSQGAVSTLPNAFWAEFFGTKHLGAIRSLATAIMVLGSAIGPGISGFAIDHGLSFPDQMPWIAVYIAVSAGMIAMAARLAARGLARPA